MIQPSDPILIVGAGSIGERHIGNLQALGFKNIIVFRTRNLPLRNIAADTIQIVTTWEHVERLQPKVAFICTPTALHLEQTMICANLGMHVFIEKPISHTPKGKDDLKKLVEKNRVFCFIGYMMHYHPLVQKMKEMIASQTFGQLISFSSHWGEYLPDWHPWEDYRDGYAARKELGGGAALTLSHDLDLIFWLTGESLKRHFLITNHKSSLEVTAEAGADFILEFESGTTGHVHLNYYERPSNRTTELVFETATVRFDYYQNTLTVKRKGESPTSEGEIIRRDDFDRNNMFVDQLTDFFKKIETFEVADSLANIDHAFKIVEMCQSE